MCGIAGIIRIHDPKEGDPPAHLDAIPEAWLDTLDESIKHRGPDGAGRFRDRATRDDGVVVDVALVHRRLSIIDHEGGHQPMVHDGDRLRPDLTYQPGETPIVASEIEPGKPLVAVVFNGCIYNHRELRKELESFARTEPSTIGHRFGSDHSDTEVIVHGWRQWGHKLLPKLDGMYSLGLWQRSTAYAGTLSDPAGEKPLWQSIDNYPASLAVFASVPPNQLSAQTNLTVDPDWNGWNGIPFPLSAPYQAGVRENWYEFHATPPDQLSFDEHDEGTTIQYISRRQTGNEFDRLLPTHFESLVRKTVQSRLEADVPLGVFLSGGIDSGLIAAIAKEHHPDIKTFTVRMPDARFDESEAAAETAKHLGTDHHTLDCDPNPADDLVHLIHQLGLPFGDSSLLPTYWVSKAAREHVKVALAGDGGDELFGGYRRHTIVRTLNRWHEAIALIPAGLLGRRRPGSRGEYLARLLNAARRGGYPELLAIFQQADLDKLMPPLYDDPLFDIDYTYHKIDDPLRYDFDHYLPDDLLRKTDTASMAVGLEVRAPFLARELVEAALRTPLDVLMPKGQRKGLLKQVARKYLPDHIVDRPKQGFAIPIGEWFRTDYGSMRTLLYDHLESADPFPGLAEAGVNINMDFVRRILREHDAAGEKSINPWHGRDHSQRLYMLLVLSIWAKWLKSIR